MNASNILTKIIEHDDVSDPSSIIDLLLPPKTSGTYTLDEIDQLVAEFQDEIETLQRESNDKFDAVLVDPVQAKLMNLSGDISKTLSDVNDLQDDISRARNQFELVKDVCRGDQVVHVRQEMLAQEESLKNKLQQSKFSVILEFFGYFCNHLETSLAACRRLSASNPTSYIQSFDWANYHQVIFLLRACGQAVRDLNRLECLYQHCRDMFTLSFRQPINKMDLNNFIEFHSSYSLETQVDVVLNSHGDRCELGKYLSEPKVEKFMDLGGSFENRLFKEYVDKVVTITVDCCRLLVDLNLNYIEAYLTDGINVDKLNGHDTTVPVENAPVETLPSYAFSPQDYITQIGQHLLALKKQTEKFDQVDNKPLMLALGNLKHIGNCDMDIESRESATEVILKCVARQIIRSLVGRTTSSVLSQLNANGKKQIATDAMYLDDVLKDLNLLDVGDPFVEKFKSLFSNATFN
jgi:hypothetical protein